MRKDKKNEELVKQLLKQKNTLRTGTLDLKRSFFEQSMDDLIGDFDE